MSLDMTPKRIQLDLEELERHPIKGVNLGPINDNLYEWMIVVDGPSTTVYEGGLFFVEITIPTDYPFNPPSIKFRTRIYHPNIDSQGRVCVDLISGNWTPQKTMHTVIEGIVSLLHHCQPEDALVPAIGEMYMNNIQEFERIARMWTKRYSLVTSTPDSESEENVQLNGKDFEGTKSNGFGLSEMM
uniref:UBC core domain-containing protein n=1 Tax=Panagrolaimus sp. JU765 TaxID=591449 RepID=A0AC34R347_9BILA